MDIIDLNVRDSEIEGLRAEVASLKQQAILRDLEIVRLREAMKECESIASHINEGALYDVTRHALSTPIDLSALARHEEEIVVPWKRDAERLAYLYSGTKTESNALVNLEMKMLDGYIPTIDEVRAAIDAAKGEKDQTP
jgi:hypothetical protein